MDNIKKNIPKYPLIIKKENILRRNCNYKILTQGKNKPSVILKEDIIYQAKEHDFLKGKYPNLKLTNLTDVKSKNSRTVATFSSQNSSIFKITSDAVTEVIGQKNYDIVFAALCSLISQEIRVKGILSLLTLHKSNVKEISTPGSTDPNVSYVKTTPKTNDAQCQTSDSSMKVLMNEKKNKKLRRSRVTSYVIHKVETLPKSPVKKVIIYPNSNNTLLKNQQDIAKVDPEEADKSIGHLDNSDLRIIFDEDSNMSDRSIDNLSIHSLDIPETVLTNCDRILNNISEHIDTTPLTPLNESVTTTLTPLNESVTTPLTLFDGSVVMLNTKVEDELHIATRDILVNLSKEDKKKMMWQQAIIDYNYCMRRDENKNLLLHNAVVNKDLDLLKRQSAMLKLRGASIDELGDGDLTALQMAIFQDMPEFTSELLMYGADPFVTDDEMRTCFHIAAQISDQHVKALITYCTNNARQVLKNNGDLWQPELETLSDVKLANYLLHEACILFDEQGYTPLMLASKVGNMDSVKLLTEAAPLSVNVCMPTSGNTALFLAVVAGCNDAKNSPDNDYKISETFKKTVEYLIIKGADPSIDNYSGHNVGTLLTNFHLAELSLVIANKMTSVNYFNGETIHDANTIMLYKNSEGEVQITELQNPKLTTKTKGSEDLKNVRIQEIRKKKQFQDAEMVNKEPSDKVNLGIEKGPDNNKMLSKDKILSKSYCLSDPEISARNLLLKPVKLLKSKNVNQNNCVTTVFPNANKESVENNRGIKRNISETPDKNLSKIRKS